MPSSPPLTATKQEIMDRVRAMAPRFAERAAAAEEARRIRKSRCTTCSRPAWRVF